MNDGLPYAAALRASAVLHGALDRVTFANPKTGYTIARIAPERTPLRRSKDRIDLLPASA